MNAYKSGRHDNQKAEQRLQDHIDRIVEAAPPLTPEQRAHLAILLRGGERGE